LFELRRPPADRLLKSGKEKYDSPGPSVDLSKGLFDDPKFAAVSVARGSDRVAWKNPFAVHRRKKAV